ncbi:MAG: PIN domain-containing protein [Chitinophagales bacterium]|nr:PIN domain-containing protein [Chitinophagales bacterium]
MKKVFLDTNVILDLNLKREPHYFDAIQIFSASKRFQFSTSSISISNTFYFVERAYNSAQAKHDMEEICRHLKVIEVGEAIVHRALKALFKEFRDFEDAIQYYSCLAEKIECIVTRNEKDFIGSKLPVYSPKMFLKLFNE